MNYFALFCRNLFAFPKRSWSSDDSSNRINRCDSEQLLHIVEFVTSSANIYFLAQGIKSPMIIDQWTFTKSIYSPFRTIFSEIFSKCIEISPILDQKNIILLSNCELTINAFVQCFHNCFWQTQWMCKNRILLSRFENFFSCIHWGPQRNAQTNLPTWPIKRLWHFVANASIYDFDQFLLYQNRKSRTLWGWKNYQHSVVAFISDVAILQLPPFCDISDDWRCSLNSPSFDMLPGIERRKIVCTL